jgi:hypothetical protein
MRKKKKLGFEITGIRKIISMINTIHISKKLDTYNRFEYKEKTLSEDIRNLNKISMVETKKTNEMVAGMVKDIEGIKETILTIEQRMEEYNNRDIIEQKEVNGAKLELVLEKITNMEQTLTLDKKIERKFQDEAERLDKEIAATTNNRESKFINRIKKFIPGGDRVE